MYLFTFQKCEKDLDELQDLDEMPQCSCGIMVEYDIGKEVT